MAIGVVKSKAFVAVFLLRLNLVVWGELVGRSDGGGGVLVVGLGAGAVPVIAHGAASTIAGTAAFFAIFVANLLVFCGTVVVCGWCGC